METTVTFSEEKTYRPPPIPRRKYSHVVNIDLQGEPIPIRVFKLLFDCV